MGTIIIGGNSQLASVFHFTYPKQSILIARKECDIRSIQDIARVFEKNNEKYVINCAAMTDIELCENNTAECFSVNTVGVYNLVRACKKYDKKLIHISSDYALNPINVYGWSKYLSEELVKNDFLALRTNFYSSKSYIVGRLLSRMPTDIYINIFFNPVSIVRLAKEIFKNRNKRGILNIFTNKKISYLEFAHSFSQVFGISQKLIKPVKYKTNNKLLRLFDSYVPSNIPISLSEDLIEFKKFLNLYEYNQK